MSRRRPYDHPASDWDCPRCGRNYSHHVSWCRECEDEKAAERNLQRRQAQAAEDAVEQMAEARRDLEQRVDQLTLEVESLREALRAERAKNQGSHRHLQDEDAGANQHQPEQDRRPRKPRSRKEAEELEKFSLEFGRQLREALSEGDDRDT